MAKKKAQYNSFKLHTNQNMMGVVMFSMIAGVTGLVVGAFMLYSSAGQAVLGAATSVVK